ncbi:exo-alpha-sialidase [Rhodohalobacter sulfatireducens]|uniref:Glycoside hydrolase n=1 Tax=Rhodohalobacter sulfatireducens TaxID=2911366 RepID=A0ABS9KAD1_9BACT|nr:sialidase family protein [Rhodohalobacter sulfatireducens]MCG2587807.1 glycoside hydrolase [Rhodohalobacter sulfatireducens]
MDISKIFQLKRLILLAIIITLISCAEKQKNNSVSDESSKAIQHLRVYYEEGRFAGWPANNGIWIWGEEILVGFVEAAHRETEGFHTYDRETARNKYARSLDGGETWTIEDAYENGMTGYAYDHSIPDELADPPVQLTEPIEDFRDPRFAITFMRDDYHDGPSTFYYSMNRGSEWNGPYSFPNLGTNGVGTRTDYIVEGPQTLSAFMNVAKENGREGRVIYSKTTDGGVNWELVSWIGEEPEGFDIMPSTVRLSETEIYTVMRSRELEPRRDFLKAFRSTDNGDSWQEEVNPAFDTGNGGSPPALVHLEDGRLALTYIYRSDYGSRVHLRFSEDQGETWGNEITLRSGDGATKDVGYPRMVQRPDGKLVVIYYWNNALQHEADPYRYIATTIVDPNAYE